MAKMACSPHGAARNQPDSTRAREFRKYPAKGSDETPRRGLARAPGGEFVARAADLSQGSVADAVDAARLCAVDGFDEGVRHMCHGGRLESREVLAV